MSEHKDPIIAIRANLRKAANRIVCATGNVCMRGWCCVHPIAFPTHHSCQGRRMKLSFTEGKHWKVPFSLIRSLVERLVGRNAKGYISSSLPINDLIWFIDCWVSSFNHYNARGLREKEMILSTRQKILTSVFTISFLSLHPELFIRHHTYIYVMALNFWLRITGPDGKWMAFHWLEAGNTQHFPMLCWMWISAPFGEWQGYLPPFMLSFSWSFINLLGVGEERGNERRSRRREESIETIFLFRIPFSCQFDVMILFTDWRSLMSHSASTSFFFYRLFLYIGCIFTHLSPNLSFFPSLFSLFPLFRLCTSRSFIAGPGDRHQFEQKKGDANSRFFFYRKMYFSMNHSLNSQTPKREEGRKCCAVKSEQRKRESDT